MSKKVSQPRFFEVGTVVEHTVYGRCIVKGYHRGEKMPYDISAEDGSPTCIMQMSYKKDLKLAGPRPPEVYEEWFK